MFGDDDVARNIHNEMQRDAAPSAEEVKAEHRKHLADEGCQYCDEDDPDELQMVAPKVAPVGPVRYDQPGTVVCDEHEETLREEEQCCLDPEWDVEKVERYRRAECQNCGEVVKGR